MCAQDFHYPGNREIYTTPFNESRGLGLKGLSLSLSANPSYKKGILIQKNATGYLCRPRTWLAVEGVELNIIILVVLLLQTHSYEYLSIHIYTWICDHCAISKDPTLSILWPIAGRLSPSERKCAIYLVILLQRTCSSHCDCLRQRVG